MKEINVDINFDTNTLEKKLLSISKHALSLAKELREIDKEINEEMIYIQKKTLADWIKNGTI